MEKKNDTKSKQIVVRFDNRPYDKIKAYAQSEHRGLGDFVRHATLVYIEQLDEEKNPRKRKA